MPGTSTCAFAAWRRVSKNTLRIAPVTASSAMMTMTGAILSVFWLTRHHAANAHVEVPGIDAQGGVSSPETPYYAQTLQSVNRQKLAQAQRTQGSFVPALSERTGSKPPDLELKPLEQSLEQRAQPVD